jgi:hypothetical protein
MNIKKRQIETMRISKERAQKLKDKAIEITLKIKELVSEQDLVNYLIDEEAEKIEISKEGKLFIKKKEE